MQLQTVWSQPQGCSHARYPIKCRLFDTGTKTTSYNMIFFQNIDDGLPLDQDWDIKLTITCMAGMEWLVNIEANIFALLSLACVGT